MLPGWRTGRSSLTASVSPFIATENVSAAVPLAAGVRSNSTGTRPPTGTLTVCSAPLATVTCSSATSLTVAAPALPVSLWTTTPARSASPRSTNRGSAECSCSGFATVNRLSPEPNR